MKKLDYIDALRGISVIGVLLVHSLYGLINDFPGSIQSIVASGGRGVQLFYMISAFTIFLSYSKRDKLEKNVNRNFFIRRFFRIAPMYYVAVVYYLLQNGLGPRSSFGQEVEVSGWSVLSNIFFFHGFYPYWMNSVVPVGWSIAIEVSFYCLVPLLFSYIKNINQALFFFIISLVLCNRLTSYLLDSQIILDQDNLRVYLFFYFPNQLPVFACGIIMFFLITESREKLVINPTILFLLSILIIGDMATEKRLFFAIFTSHIMFALAFITLGYALSKKRFNIIVNPVTRYLGKISYSMYLVHMGVLYWIEKFKINTITAQNSAGQPLVQFIIRFFLLTILSIVISMLFYHIVEVPGQQIGKRLIKKIDKVRATESLSVLSQE